MEAITKAIDVILFPIAEPVKIIVDAILKLVELVVLLVTAIPEVLKAALQIFNPVAVLNDMISGLFLGINITNVLMRGKEYLDLEDQEMKMEILLRPLIKVLKIESVLSQHLSICLLWFCAHR